MHEPGSAEVVLVGVDAGELGIVSGRVAVPDVDVGIRKGLAAEHVKNTNLENHRNTDFAIFIDCQSQC